MAHCKQTLAAVLLVVTALTACGEAEVGEGPQQAPGEADFARYCASCHGQQGEGRPPAFPPLAGSEWVAMQPEGLTAIILLGLRGEIEVAGQRYAGYMPPMQHIDDERLAAIVRYIKKRWAEPAEGWSAAEVGRVRAAVAGRRSPEGRSGVETILEEMQ